MPAFHAGANFALTEFQEIRERRILLSWLLAFGVRRTRAIDDVLLHPRW
jgi:hypothetical protein